MSHGVNAMNGRLVFGLAGGIMTGGVLHMEDAGLMRKGDVSICRTRGDKDVISRKEDDKGVFPHMGDEDEGLHMEDAASRMEDDLGCTRVACRSCREEDETDSCGLSCLDSRCKEDNKGEDPL